MEPKRRKDEGEQTNEKDQHESEAKRVDRPHGCEGRLCRQDEQIVTNTPLSGWRILLREEPAWCTGSLVYLASYTFLPPTQVCATWMLFT
jgi:hypothetical protein